MRHQGRLFLNVWTMAAVLCLTLLSGCSKRAEPETESTYPETLPETKEEATIAPFPEEKETEEIWEPVEKPDSFSWDDGWDGHLILGTDIHYYSPELTDYGESFQYMVEHGDGKVVTYIDEITDAFLEEVIHRKPDVLVLSGDLTLDGEKKSHEELAGKLYRVKEAGIPVLVVPGNHDINNRHAARYEGSERKPAEYTTPEEFREIYRDFGYDEAFSEDAKSLSYIYELDPYTWVLMIDSCQYTQKALVGGAIRQETYEWLEGWLNAAWNQDIRVIAVAHHNLLDESEIYVDDCTIEHGEQLARILNEWEVPAFLSGHLHVQHAKRYHDGVWEMVTSSLATPDCRYGVMEYRGTEEFRYFTQSVDVERWARDNGSSNEDLLNFDKFKEPFLRQVFYNQAMDEFEKKEFKSLTDEQKEQMAQYYSNLNYHYYQGDAFKIREEAMQDEAYDLWEDEGGGSELSEYLNYILQDAVMDYNQVAEE